MQVSPAHPQSARAGTAAGAASVALLIGLAAAVGQRLWFFSDDWNILTEYHGGNLLDPFNGHLSLLPAGLFQLVAQTLGVESYLPFRALGLASLLVLGFQVFRYCSDRLSWSAHGTWGAALAVTAVLWNSSGVTNVMFPFLMNFSLPIAALVAIWWHLDRDEPRNDRAASLWLVVALASSGLGVVTLGAVMVELLARRAPLRRWTVLSPGPLLWLAWFVTNREANDWASDPLEVTSYAARMLLGGTTSLAAGWAPAGVLLAVAFVGLVLVAALRWRSLDARSLAALAAPLGFVLSTSLTRLDIVPSIPPDELRYSWTVAALLVVATVTLWRRDDWWTGQRVLRPAVAALAVVLVVVGAVRLVSDIRDWVDTVAEARPGLEAVLLATELTGSERVDVDRVLPLSYVPVTAGRYLEAVEALGSPVDGTPAPTRGANGIAADEFLVGDLGLVLVDGAAGCAQGAPDVGAPGDRVIVASPGRSVVIQLPAGSGPDIAVSRFAAGDDAVAVPVAPRVDTRRPVRLELPPDAELARGATLPYRVSVPAGTLVELCE